MMKNCWKQKTTQSWWCRWLICLGLDGFFFFYIFDMDNRCGKLGSKFRPVCARISSLIQELDDYKQLQTTLNQLFWRVANGLLSLWLNCEYFLTWTSHSMSPMAVSNQQWLLCKNLSWWTSLSDFDPEVIRLSEI